MQQAYDVDLFKLLRKATADIDREILKLKFKEGIGAATRTAQLQHSKRAIWRTLSWLWRQTGDLTRAGRHDAQVAAILQSFNWEEFLLVRAIPERDRRIAILEFLVDSADRNVDAMLARVFQTQQTLSQRVYRAEQLSKGWVSEAINSALARGATVPELAEVVRDMIRPETKGGVSYAAKRLARTEINNAYHAQAIDSARDKPWLRGMKWKLSESHPERDECNDYAEQENGLGAGVWPIERVPKKPHPQCLCYIIPELPTIAEFDRNLRIGLYDAYMDEHFSADIDTPGKLAG